MTSVPNCDKTLIQQALREGVRLDGRGPNDFRDLHFEFSPDSTSCLCHLGQTRVLSCVHAELGVPKHGHDQQGTVSFKLGFDANLLPETPLLGNVKYQTVMLIRWLERLFFGGNALDREALCLIPGQLVWHLEVDVRILDYDGNSMDACVLSTLGALAAYRRPQVTPEQMPGRDDVKITVHSVQDREPLPLTLHHLPISVSFGTFQRGEGFVVDPSLQESSAMKGGMACVADPQGNLLNVQKLYGMPLSISSISNCCRIALEKAQQISRILQQALEQHEAQRVTDRVVRVHDGRIDDEGVSPLEHKIPTQILDLEDQPIYPYFTPLESRVRDKESSRGAVHGEWGQGGRVDDGERWLDVVAVA